MKVILEYLWFTYLPFVSSAPAFIPFSFASEKSRRANRAPLTQQRNENLHPERAACDHDDDRVKIQRLLDELEDQEVEGLDGLEVRRNEKSQLRGLYATADWKYGDYVCALPFTAAILVQQTDLLGNQEDTEGGDESVMREEGEQGILFLELMESHRAYVDCLPRFGGDSFDPTPDFWSREELELIPVPRLRESALRRKQILGDIADAHSVDFHLLQWATWVIRTRGFSTFRMLDSGVLKTCFLLPLFDFINHKPKDESVVLDVLETDEFETSMFALRATKDIASGDELTITYGTGYETCLDHVDKYGFWLEDGQNKADDLLDWSLFDQSWKESLLISNIDSATVELPDGHKLSTAQRLNRYLESLYREKSGKDKM